jgi:hypothetical protein
MYVFTEITGVRVFVVKRDCNRSGYASCVVLIVLLHSFASCGPPLHNGSNKRPVAFPPARSLCYDLATVRLGS